MRLQVAWVLSVGAIVGTLGTGASACSSSGGGKSSAGGDGGASSGGEDSSGSSGAHQFAATLTITGYESGTQSFTQTLATLPPCATLAQKGDGASQEFDMPEANSLTFQLSMGIMPYTGPGTYTTPSSFPNAEFVGTDGFEYDPVSSTTYSATVNADASGSASFTNLQSAVGNSVDGTLTWTCE